MSAIAFLCRIGAYSAFALLAAIARAETGWNAYVLAGVGMACVFTQAVMLDD